MQMATDTDTTIADTLTALRARVDELAGNADRLRSHLAVAVEAGGVVEAESVAAEAGLVTGASTVGDVLRLRSEVATGAQRVAALREALGKVEGERQRVADQIVAAEREIARRADEAASESLRTEATACVAAFVQGVLTLSAPLRRRRELAARLAADFPLATRIPALDGADLARAILKVHGRDVPLYAILPWVARVLAAPGDRVADPVTLRDTLGVTLS